MEADRERTKVKEADQAVLEQFADTIQAGDHVAEFSYDSDIHRIVIKIYSSSGEPREVVRQIPTEEFLNFSVRYRKLLGVLFDEQA